MKQNEIGDKQKIIVHPPSDKLYSHSLKETRQVTVLTVSHRLLTESEINRPLVAVVPEADDDVCRRHA